MLDSLKAACVQMTSGVDISENLQKCEKLVREAAAQGATLVMTPENTCHMRNPAGAKYDSARTQEDHEGVKLFSKLSAELGIWLLIGSMTIKREDGRLANRSFLFSPDGELVHTYDKIHLFDVQLSTGETHKESDLFVGGDKAVLASLDEQFTLGLSICYDLRFAYLYRDLAKAGANILCIPAAFTVPTGLAHWETLLRARAIETGSYVLAAAQVGEHENGRKTYGHSMIIDPWGSVISVKKEGEGLIFADLNSATVKNVRSAIPALKHDKPFEIIKN